MAIGICELHDKEFSYQTIAEWQAGCDLCKAADGETESKQ